MGKSVLIVDDEELIRRSLRLSLEGAGYEVSEAGSGAEAMAVLAGEIPDCTILDLRLGDLDGFEVFRALRARSAAAKVVVITAHGDVDSAVQALRLGAFDFVRKPFDLEEVLSSVGNALRVERLENEIRYHQERKALRQADLVFEHASMRAALEAVERVAAQPVPVLLVTGESGTGKELASRAFHAASDRASRPFIELNCSALPEHLVESELFGHERGAFSDAREQKKGLVELADGGTLFLDEVGDLPAPAQAKLLRFVETQQFRRVGGVKLLSVDCRIVAATHRDLRSTPSFRPDLYFRLSGTTVELPPLRTRGGDVLLLARHFLAEFARRYGKRIERITPAAEELLLSHDWPGNVRELKAAVSQAVLLAEGTELGPERFAQLRRGQGSEPTSGQPRTLAAIEVDYCRQVLRLCNGNKALAAQRLGISRNTLDRKLLGSRD